MTDKYITDPNPEWFTTIGDTPRDPINGMVTGEPHVYPFFGTEDGDLFGLGHQDPAAFTEEVRRYWKEVGDDAYDADDIRVEHRWYCVEEADDPAGDYAFFIHGYVDDRGHECVTAETPGAVAITTVRF